MKDKNVNHILLKSRQGSRLSNIPINNSVLDYINKYGLNKNIFMSGDITLKTLIDRIIYQYKKGNTNTEAIFIKIIEDLINHKIK